MAQRIFSGTGKLRTNQDVCHAVDMQKHNPGSAILQKDNILFAQFNNEINKSQLTIRKFGSIFVISYFCTKSNTTFNKTHP